MCDRRALNMNQHVFLIGILCVLGVVFALSSEFFLTWPNIINIFLASSTIGLLAIGAGFIIGSAGLDLSVGSLMALCVCVAASLSGMIELGWTFIIILCLLSGLVVGAVNGALITFANIPAFIATLGMLSIARGGALIFTDGRPVYGLPDAIVYLGQGTLIGIPVPIWIFLVTGLVLHLVLRYTTFGKYTLVIGDNEKAVHNVGINVKAHKIKLYMLSGFLAALAGLIFMGRVNAADPSSGMMYELTAITAAIIGGTHLFGGRASVIGAMIGALIMGVLQNGLTLLAVPSYYQQVAIGTVLILAVGFDGYLKRGRKC